MNISLLLGAALVACALACLQMPALMRAAPHLRLLDEPGERKRHTGAVPLVGGVAIVVAALLTVGFLSLWLEPDYRAEWAFALSILLLMGAGLLDDSIEIKNWQKALLQIVALLPGLFFADLRVLSLGPLFGGDPIALGPLTIPFTLLCLLVYINALNLIDGVDGLAGGIAFIAFAFLAAIAWECNAWSVFLVIIVFASATLGFLGYNLRTPWRGRAAVFLGDAGSMVLGLVIAWCAIRLGAYSAPPGINPMGIAWILALPVMDTVVVMTRRILLRRNPFTPDRRHLHHVLADLGLTPGKTVTVLISLSVLYGLIGVLGSYLGAPEWALLIVFVAATIGHAAFVLGLHDRAVSAARLPRQRVRQ